MLVSKPSTRLGLLAVFALAGVSACATWPAYRVPQGPLGTSADVVVPSSPPVSEVVANPAAAAPLSPSNATTDAPGEAPVAPTISVPGPLVAIPATQPRGDSETSGPAASTSPPAASPVAPSLAPAAPPAAPELPRSVDITPPEATAPSAESNRNELHPQKPLEVTSLNSDQSTSGQQSAGGVGPGLAIAVGKPAPPQATAATPANRPPSALAKLRARFHNLIQPSSKPASKPSKNAKSPATDPAATPHEPPPAVARVRIPLPTSDESRVVKEDVRSLHGLYPADEGQGPVATAGARNAQTGLSPVDPAVAQADNAFPHETIEKPAATAQIEQWPYGPQVAASVPKASNPPASLNEFDPIPVEEYKAAVARVNGEAPSLPAFHQTPPTPNDGLHAASASPIVAAPQPPAPAPPASDLQVVPTADASPTATPPALIRIDQAEPRPSIEEQSGSSEHVDVKERPETEQPAPVMQPTPPPTDSPSSAGSPAPVAPAVQMSAAPAQPAAAPAQPVAAPIQPAGAPTQAPAVRSPQWVGGRYGQPAWMVPYAAPAVPRGN